MITHILIGSVLMFVFGAVWFTVLFGKKWAELMNWSEKDLEVGKDMGMAIPMMMNFVVNLITVSVLYFMIQNIQVFSFAGFMRLVFIIWLGFSFPIYANARIWERKTWMLVVINSLQSLLALTLVSYYLYNFAV